MTEVKESLPIVIDKNTKVLIIGTFPGATSRNNGYYYAKSSNRFWKIMNELYGIHIPKNKSEYIKYSRPQLLNKRIGLWDVIHFCKFKKDNSSRDSDIIKDTIILNDFENLLNVRKIIFICNGLRAEKWLKKYFKKLNFESCESTSPANTRDFKKNDRTLCEFWGQKRTQENIIKYWKIKLNRILGDK